MLKIQLKAYRAIDEPGLCKEYMDGHIKVLLDYGITNITSNNAKWAQHSNTYCVVAKDEDGEMVGGIRVQVRDEALELPVESAIGYMDENVYSLVEELRVHGGVGELCGLWNSRKVKGQGVSLILTRAGISIVKQLKIQSLIGICGGYSLPMFRRVGFIVDKRLGNMGEFLYPNKDNIARVVGILNALSLDSAQEYDRKMMQGLQKTPIINRVEMSYDSELEVEYNLKLKSITELSLNKVK